MFEVFLPNFCDTKRRFLPLPWLDGIVGFRFTSPARLAHRAVALLHQLLLFHPLVQGEQSTEAKPTNPTFSIQFQEMVGRRGWRGWGGRSLKTDK